MESEHDQAFLQILKEEKNITNFLDAFFGFLYRCTDFYVESNAEQKLGFPAGIAEKLVLNSLQKWKNISMLPNRIGQNENNNVNVRERKVQRDESPAQSTGVPGALEDVGVSNTDDQGSDKSMSKDLETDPSSDSYNGAVRENYTWSQSITDLDVLIKLPEYLKSAKDLRVNLESQGIKVQVKSCAIVDESARVPNSDWTTVFEGELSFRTRKDESVWSIIPGKYISIHLEKASERWWEALLVGEPKIELSKIDCSRKLDEMGSAEQMKVQELMWNHQQKLLGKPTSEQIKMEQILKQAWDAKGSPFEGTPYDPSILKFN